MGQVCFGVEPCSDGSVVVAARQGAAITVQRIAPGAAQCAAVVELVKSSAPAPRVCVAARNGRGLNLALALGTLEAAEVMVVRAEVVEPSKPMAEALAAYARRAA